ncbi:MAG: outer membrane beta-barrel protein [Crocinitomicaceae bacterium]
MKKIIFVLIGLSIFGLSSSAQSQDVFRRFEITTGFGFQQYNGDLGNGFFNTNNVVYGVASLGLNYKLTNSFSLKLLGTVGDLGYCHEDEIMANRVPQPIGHGDHHSDAHNTHFLPEEEILSSRLFTGTIAIQYNFANGIIMPIDSRFRPSFYLGIGVNKLTDIMKMRCVNIGNYSSFNTGLGLQYSVSKQFSVGYNLGFGLLTSDKIDFISKGKNDMYMQNSATVVFAF